MNVKSFAIKCATPASAPSTPPCALHRIKAVRRERGIAIGQAARRLGKTVEQLRIEEDETTDLRLSQLHAWQQLLGVPMAELLVDSFSPLSTPSLEQTRLYQLMETVTAILRATSNPSIRRMAQTMVGQLLEIMPELQSVAPGHSPTESPRPALSGRLSLRSAAAIAARCKSSDRTRADMRSGTNPRRAGQRQPKAPV